eukprot:gene20839-32135_t
MYAPPPLRSGGQCAAARALWDMRDNDDDDLIYSTSSMGGTLDSGLRSPPYGRGKSESSSSPVAWTPTAGSAGPGIVGSRAATHPAVAAGGFMFVDDHADAPHARFKKQKSFMGLPCDDDDGFVISEGVESLDPNLTYMRRDRKTEPLQMWRVHRPANATVEKSNPTIAAVLEKGPRSTMEDDFFSEKFDDVAIGIVCDGHGGAQVAEYCCREVIRQAKEKLQSIMHHSSAFRALEFPHLLTDSLIETDLKLLQAGRYMNQGTTATVIAVSDSECNVAWVGDSRAVLCDAGVAVPLTRDHNMKNEEEVSRQKRVAGVEAIQLPLVTRAIGDFSGKHGIKENHEIAISNRPEVTSFPITQSTTFAIIASDGLWDVVQDQEAVDIVNRTLADTPFYQGDVEKYASTPVDMHRSKEDFLRNRVCRELIRTAIERRSGDNITVMIFLLHDVHSIVSAAKKPCDPRAASASCEPGACSSSFGAAAAARAGGDLSMDASPSPGSPSTPQSPSACCTPRNIFSTPSDRGLLPTA